MYMYRVARQFVIPQLILVIITLLVAVNTVDGSQYSKNKSTSSRGTNKTTPNVSTVTKQGNGFISQQKNVSVKNLENLATRSDLSSNAGTAKEALKMLNKISNTRTLSTAELHKANELARTMKEKINSALPGAQNKVINAQARILKNHNTLANNIALETNHGTKTIEKVTSQLKTDIKSNSDYVKMDTHKIKNIISKTKQQFKKLQTNYKNFSPEQNNILTNKLITLQTYTDSISTKFAPNSGAKQLLEDFSRTISKTMVTLRRGHTHQVEHGVIDYSAIEGQ